MFLERGFEGASIDELAAVARAGKPTIYTRFPGKEALFAAVMARHVREVTGSYETIAPIGHTRRAPGEHRHGHLAENPAILNFEWVL